MILPFNLSEESLNKINRFCFIKTVESSSDQLRKRVEAVLDMALTTVTSLADAYISNSTLVSEELTKEKFIEGEKGTGLGKEGDVDVVVKAVEVKVKLDRLGICAGVRNLYDMTRDLGKGTHVLTGSDCGG